MGAGCRMGATNACTDDQGLAANDDLEARTGTNVVRDAPATKVRKPTTVEFEAKEYGH